MSSENQFSLLKSERFAPFFVTQALGAFNDNVFKTMLALLIAFQSVQLLGQDSNFWINACAMIFILPFFMFSATAGQIADKYEKSALIRKVKFAEILIMLLAAFGMFFEQVGLLIGVLFLMGTQSTVFGPIKYSIIPQHLTKRELLGGNALVESGTFVAILIGTIFASVLMSLGDKRLTFVAVTVIGTAMLGYWASRKIPTAPAASPDLKINWNPFTETFRNFRFMRTNRQVFLAVVGISWFWFFGAILLTQIPNFAKTVLGGSESSVGVLLALFSLGIGLGSLLCERFSGRKLDIGLVPFGSIGLTVFAIDFFFASNGRSAGETVALSALLLDASNWRIFFDLMMLGVFGGLYIVPLYAMVQTRSSKEHLARIIAGNNIMNSAFMVIAGMLSILVFANGASIAQLFLMTGILNAVVALFIYLLIPEFLLRFVAWVLGRLMYRIRISGLENIPDEGPVVLVCNHISYVDAIILLGSIPRPTRFVMYHKIYDIPLMKAVFKAVNAISIAPKSEDKAVLDKAYDEISQAIRDGEVVCIFPEGSLTKDGKIGEFKAGIERIVERDPAVVVPMAIKGLWGSIFSHKEGKLSNRRERKFFAPIQLNVGAALSATEATAAELQKQVTRLKASEQPA